MPKRTTNFQDLIGLLEYQLAPTGARVTASKLFRDARSGEEREVDIVIETVSGIHPLTIGIEVIEHKRPASATWIEGIAKKHEDLAIDKSIAVSWSGFYQPAIIKAKAYKIDTLTLQEASKLNWKAKIMNMPSVKIVSFLLPYLTEATLIFTEEMSTKQFDRANLGLLNLYEPSGEMWGSVQKVLDNLITNHEFIQKLEQKAFPNSGTIVQGELCLPKGCYVFGLNEDKHPLYSIKFKVRCEKEEVNVELLKGAYRETAVVMATGTTFGRAVQMVFSEQKDQESPIFSIQIK